MEGSSDALVVARVLRGDVEAFRVLVERYRDRYARYAYHMLGNREDAEEALQDAFTRAYRSLARCEDPEILLNRCRTMGARRGRRARTFIVDDVALLEAAEEHPADRTAWREEIDRALLKLRADQREAFLLKYVEELGYDEMSLLTGVGVSALKMRVMRACDRLRELLSEVHNA